MPCRSIHDNRDLRVGDILCPDDALICVNAHGVGVGLGVRFQRVDLSSLLIASFRYFGAGLAFCVTDDRFGLRLHCPDGVARSFLQRFLAGNDHLQWYACHGHSRSLGQNRPGVAARRRRRKGRAR